MIHFFINGKDIRSDILEKSKPVVVHEVETETIRLVKLFNKTKIVCGKPDNPKGY